MTKHFSIIVAATRLGGIGYQGRLPWPRLEDDLKHFHHLTCYVEDIKTVNAVIMGRKTYESMPRLAGRLSIVITTQSNLNVNSQSNVNVNSDMLVIVPDFEAALNVAQKDVRVGKIWIGGGEKVYEAAMKSPFCEAIYLTQVLKEFPFDTCFPPVDLKRFTLREVQDVKFNNEVPFQILRYDSLKQINQEEEQYLDLVRHVLDSGITKTDRTGVGTLSKFGATARYSLRNGRIPLLTTKRVFWRGVAEELLWILKGGTSAKQLQEKNVRIWDGNGTKDFLESIGQGHREEFDLGPIYGHQWRFFGSEYIDCHTDYKGQGVDQLAEIVRLIKTSPDSRRIVLSAWNPVDLTKMALPPCHVLCQFSVANGELSCVMYQRSCDLGLGVPFNIASYSLLTHLLAAVCELRPGDFVHMMGDTHVYLNHIDALKEQIKRTPSVFPSLRFKRPIANMTDWSFEDLELIDYHPQESIKMSMAV